MNSSTAAKKGTWIVKLLFACCISLIGEISMAKGNSEALEFCKQELTRIEKSVADVSERIHKWEALEPQCKGTGLYEYQLAKYYIQIREYKKSEEAIENGMQQKTVYDKELALARGDIYLHQKDYAEAEKVYRMVIKEYPDWYAGYNYLGFSLFAQGKNQEAVTYLDKANKLTETADTYRTLTLTHYLLGNYEKAVESLNRAFSLDESIIGDRDPMVAGVRSYAELGKFEVARNLLAMLLQKRPDIKNDQEFLKAGLFLRQKMIEAGLVAD
jgi:tetratricopeptide (TPR) repeat protein